MTKTVEISSGVVDGFDDDGVLTFLGIPYAAAPVGNLRFKPPEPVTPWSGVLVAGEWGPTPPQPNLPITAGLPPQGEDCLRVSVWTPSTTGSDRPVMAWIHGGAYSVMAASDPGWNGRNLARTADVVVVSIEYRTGALGFLHLADAFGPEFEGSGCAGILDQIAALRWVGENAAAFGGNPANITLFGESAGAMSIGTLLAMPEAAGLFSKAVLQSGASHAVLDRETAAEGTGIFLGAAGVSDPGDLLSMTPEQIVEIQVATTLDIIRDRRGPERALGMAWAPVVDGLFLPQHPIDAVAEGSAKEIPLIIGTTRDEFRLFSVLMSMPLPRDEEKLAARVRHVFGDRGDPDRAARGYVQDAGGDPAAAATDFLTDLIFRIPAERLAEAQSQHRKDTLVYRFDWPSPLLDGRLGACHAIELPFLFDPGPDSVMAALAGPNPPRGLTSVVQGAWGDFAHDREVRLDPLGIWPCWNPKERPTALLDSECTVAEAPDAERLARWDGV